MANPNIMPSSNTYPTVELANAMAKNHPELMQKSPQIGAAAISSGSADTALTLAASQTIAAHAQALADHQQQYNSESTWSNILGGATKAAGVVTQGLSKIPGVSTVMQWANKPLQEIQKDYKFLHSVYTDHSVWQGVLATLGVAGGATAGFFTAGPLGAVAGADLALAGERNLSKIIPNFKNSIAKSEDPNYLVSPGRDLSNALGQIPGFSALKDTQHGFGQTISGVADAVFDFGADPLVKGGQLNAALKTGKYVGAAVDDTGKTLLDEAGKPMQIKATLPIAAQSKSVNDFMVSYSGKAYSGSQVLDAYDNPLNTGLRRAVNTIAETSNPIEIQRLFPRSQFTAYEANKLAKATTPQQVINEMGKSLYSSELVAQDAVPRTTLILPTQTVARAFVDKGLKAIRQDGTSLNEERNLLLPKTSTVVDEAGNPLVNPDGTIQKQTLQGALPTALAKLGIFDISGAKAAAINGLAAKVRTFTGYKALSINAKTLEQSGKNFTWDDPNLGPQIYNTAYYSMPHDLALEHTAKIMLEPDLATKQEMYGNLVKEVVKNAGLSANDAIVDRVMSQAQRATDNGELSNIAYGHDESGAPRGYVDMKDGGKQGVALWSWQRGSNAFIDFKELRNAIRQSTIHSLLYQKLDDGFTYYTDKIFAPLTLFSTGFGLRVASSEALHQIIRAGLGDYLQSQVAQSAAKYNILHKLDNNTILRYADSAAQALTSEDHAALLSGKPVIDNAVTKLIQQKADIYKNLSNTERVNELATDIRGISNRVSPVGFINSKIAPYVAADKLDVVTKYQQLMGHVGIPAGVASDHGKSFKNNADDRVDILSQLMGHTAKPTEEIASLTGTNPHYHQYWAQNLSKLRNEEMAKDIASDWQKFSKSPEWANLSNDEKWGQVKASFQARVADTSQYRDLRDTMVGLSKGDPASYANEVVSSFRGLVEGASGKIHEDLINNIKNGERTYETALKNIPTTDSPFAILGKSHKPNWSNPTDKVLDLGYRTFINPVIDHVSREPIFAHYLYENFRDLKPLLDSGAITEDEALRLSGQKATVAMVPLIHNPALRSQWATMSRNLFPFYFAQEQALKRIGRLGLQDGRAIRTFRDFQMIQQGFNNPGFVHTDSTGKQYIVYPLVGEFGNAALRGFQALGLNSFSGMPESVIGNTASLATVLPEVKMPGVSPLGNIAITELGKRFPWMEKASQVATGGFPATNWLDTVLPNSSIRAVFNGLTMDQRVNAVHNATLSAIASAQYHGIIDDKFPMLPPAQQQQILDKVENNAKSNLFIQGILSFFLPLAPNVSNNDYNKNLQSLRDEYQSLIKSGLTLAQAQDKFLSSHGNQAISYTVGFSKTKENGATIPLSDTTIKWLAENDSIIKSNPNGAAYLIPQNTQGGDIQTIENKLLAMHLRAQQTPVEFMNSVYVSKGWVDLGQDFKDYQAAIQEAKKTNNVTALGQISQAWKAVSESYALQNPIWWSSYKDPTKTLDAKNALQDFQTLQGAGKLGNTLQAQGIANLLTSYNDYHAAISQQTKGTKLTSIGYLIQDAWNNYLDTEMTNNPNLSNVINGVFRRVS
jgi:hypothetical protein